MLWRPEDAEYASDRRLKKKIEQTESDDGCAKKLEFLEAAQCVNS